jgi:hypothetical protein
MIENSRRCRNWPARCSRWRSGVIDQRRCRSGESAQNGRAVPSLKLLNVINTKGVDVLFLWSAGHRDVALHTKASLERKAGTEQLLDTLEKALAGEIRTLPWMSEDTKRIAEGKLAALHNRTGHPERWRDYSALKVDRNEFLGDLHRSAVFERNYLLSKLGKPAAS